VIRTRLRGNAALGRALRDSMIRENNTRAELELLQESVAANHPELDYIVNRSLTAIGRLFFPVDAPVSAKDDALAPCPFCDDTECVWCGPAPEAP
jgi:hypothetical protein